MRTGRGGRAIEYCSVFTARLTTPTRRRPSAVRLGRRWLVFAGLTAQFVSPVAHGQPAATGAHAVTAPAARPVRFASIVAGGDHTCALSETGQAFCWGVDDFGQLGVGGAAQKCAPPFDGLISKERRRCSTSPRPVAGDLRFQSLSAGPDHTCGITVDSLAYCWGDNLDGELGTSGLADRCTKYVPAECSLVPVAVSGGHQFISVSAGAGTTCALTGDGALYCWGMVGDRPSPNAMWASGTCQHTETQRQPGITAYACTQRPTRIAADLPFVHLATPFMLDSAGSIFVLWGHAVRPHALDDTASLPIVPLAKLASRAPCGLTPDDELYCWRTINNALLDQPPSFSGGLGCLSPGCGEPALLGSRRHPSGHLCTKHDRRGLLLWAGVGRQRGPIEGPLLGSRCRGPMQQGTDTESGCCAGVSRLCSRLLSPLRSHRRRCGLLLGRQRRGPARNRRQGQPEVTDPGGRTGGRVGVTHTRRNRFLQASYSVDRACRA